MRIALGEARGLVERAMRKLGHDEEEAAIVADHLVDAELRGQGYLGLARAISIVERYERLGGRKRPIRIEREGPTSAMLDGGDHTGYVVAHRATRLAIAKARQGGGVAAVAARDSWYSGILSHYAEAAAAEGLVSLVAGNSSPWIAPHGAAEGRYGTNPICFGFPTTGDPIVWDIGTSGIMHSQILLAKRLGRALPEGSAFDREGAPTTDPEAALAGCFAGWGGHKGSGLGLVVQLLGILAGSPPLPMDIAGYGFLIVCLDPELFVGAQAFRQQAAAYAEAVRAARPAPGAGPVRMPGDRAAAERRLRLAEGEIEVPEAIVSRLRSLG